MSFPAITEGCAFVKGLGMTKNIELRMSFPAALKAAASCACGRTAGWIFTKLQKLPKTSDYCRIQVWAPAGATTRVGGS